MPLASAGPSVLVLSNGSGSILLDVRVGRGALQSGILGLGSPDLRTVPSGQNLYALVLIHTTAVTAPEHQAKIPLPVL